MLSRFGQRAERPAAKFLPVQNSRLSQECAAGRAFFPRFLPTRLRCRRGGEDPLDCLELVIQPLSQDSAETTRWFACPGSWRLHPTIADNDPAYVPWSRLRKDRYCIRTPLGVPVVASTTHSSRTSRFRAPA